MAFGRSNSLSINTGASNSTSLFGQPASTQPAAPAAGSLFGGGNTQTTQPQQSGGLFGSTTTQQPSGGLFGNTTAQPTQQSGGLFGNTTTQPQAGGMFGSTTTQPQAGGSLFGNTTTQQPQQSGGLFGNTTTQQPPQQTGGLFGSSTTQQQPSTSLFGNTTTQPQSSSLFGNNSTQQRPQQQNNNPTPSIFSLSAMPATQIPSLLQLSQFNASRRQAPFAGSLSMGQHNHPAQQNTATVGAVKVNVSELRPTTRFQDCVDEVKSHFERADSMIQKQEEFCRQIQAVLSQHEVDVGSIAPDVEMVGEKVEVVEGVLVGDAVGVDGVRRGVEGDGRDLGRCRRVVENLKLPAAYHQHQHQQTHNNGGLSYGQQFSVGAAGEDYDTDLISNYFAPLTTTLSTSLAHYSANLAEIEQHMRLLESSAVAQAQSLSARRNGGGGGGGGEETVRELAETLAGFEQGLLGVAGVVGDCREGVGGLVVGRLGGGRGGW